MGNTTISWTNKTWNPTRGCSRVSQGCVNCYAERQAARFARASVHEDWPEGTQPGPFHGFVTKVNGHAAWTGKVELIESKLGEPLSWKKPARVFVNSMSDLFHEALPDEAIDRVFAVMALCPRLTFQVLTKRPNRMLEYLSGEREDWIAQAVESRNWAPGIDWNAKDTPPLDDWPLPNVHLGVSVEDQKTADERSAILRQVPAAKRFISQEPQLGPIEWTAEMLRGISQIIVGGESGPGARPFDIAWPRQTLTQCRAANVAFFMKQFGSNPRESYPGDMEAQPLFPPLFDRKGGDMSEWPEDLRVRELI